MRVGGLERILIDQGAVTQVDLDRARDVQRVYGGQLGEILIRIGAVGEEEVLRGRCCHLGLDLFEPEMVPPDLASLAQAMEPLAPIDWWVRQHAVAWRDSGGSGVICVARDPTSA